MPVPSLVSADGSCCTWALLTATAEKKRRSKLTKSILSHGNFIEGRKVYEVGKNPDGQSRSWPWPPSDTRSPRSPAPPAAAPRTQEHRGQTRSPALPHPAAPSPAPRCCRQSGSAAPADTISLAILLLPQCVLFSLFFPGNFLSQAELWSS